MTKFLHLVLSALPLAAITAYSQPILKKTVTSPFSYLTAASCGLKNRGFALTGEFSATFNNRIGLQGYDSLGNPTWNSEIGDSSASQFAASLVQTQDGGLAILGSYLPINANFSSSMLAKTDSLGRLEFQVYDTSGFVGLHGIAATADSGVVLAGEFHENQYSALLVKFDKRGKKIWSHKYPYGSANEGLVYAGWEAVLETPDRGFLLAGKGSALKLGTGIFVVKTDSEGEAQWWRCFPEGSEARIADMAVTPEGNFLVSGSWAPPGFQAAIPVVLELSPDGQSTQSHLYGTDTDIRYNASFYAVKPMDGGWISTVSQPDYYKMLIKYGAHDELIWQFSLANLSPGGSIPFSALSRGPGKYVVCPKDCFLIDDLGYGLP